MPNKRAAATGLAALMAGALLMAPAPLMAESGLDLGKMIELGGKINKASRPMNRQDEKALGKEVARDVFKRYGPLSSDRERTSYVAAIGATLAQQYKDRRSYRFAVIDSAEANAFAAPGGYVFVTSGLLNILQDESELAGVIAHEMAHIYHEHMIKTLQRHQKATGAAGVLEVLSGGESEGLSQLARQAEDLLFTKGYDKKYEFEADSSAVVWAAMAGYDPSGLRRFLSRLDERRHSVGSIFFSTHPPAHERVKKVGHKLARLGKGGQKNVARFDSRTAR